MQNLKISQLYLGKADAKDELIFADTIAEDLFLKSFYIPESLLLSIKIAAQLKHFPLYSRNIRPSLDLTNLSDIYSSWRKKLQRLKSL